MATNEAMKTQRSNWEEAKADILGLFLVCHYYAVVALDVYFVCVAVLLAVLSECVSYQELYAVFECRLYLVE